jgi:hypothetical protein
VNCQGWSLTRKTAGRSLALTFQFKVAVARPIEAGVTGSPI